jgi:hypothetical protein
VRTIHDSADNTWKSIQSSNNCSVTRAKNLSLMQLRKWR